MRYPRLTHVLGAAAAGTLALGGCAFDPAGPASEDGLGQGLERTGMTITESSSVAAELCQVGVDGSGVRAWPAGRQLLIYRAGVLRGMCTVATATHTSGASTILARRAVMVDRIWEGADGNPPATSTVWTLPTASSTTTVTVRDQWYAGAPVPVPDPAAPAVVSAGTLAGIELDDSTPREYLSALPAAGATAVNVGYIAPHPFENPAPGNGLGRALLQWKAAEAAGDTARDAFWTIGMQGDDGDYVTDPRDGSNITNTRRFHITSTDISRDSFPGVGALIDGDLDYAVAFHGSGDRPDNASGCDQGLLVGGRLGLDRTADPLAFRRGIAENIRLLVNPADDVTPGGTMIGLVPDQVRYTAGASTSATGIAGCSFDEGIGTTNIVNRLATYTGTGTGGVVVHRGVQLESGFALDPAIYERVGRATHEVFDCLNAPAEETVAEAASFARSTGSADYATGATDRCRGWVVDATLTAGTHTFTGGLATCTAGAKAHVDIYRWNDTASSWDRVGGGDVSYADVGGTCTPSYAAWDDNTLDAGVPVFEPGTDADAAGRYRMIVYGYQPTVAVPHFTAAAALPVQAAVM
ncbi:MAG TPA: hypothetical protein VNO30_33165 [Kofleriaceae bacterium]|nr:hypothetical protein [Kofleriaceae bacterium]